MTSLSSTMARLLSLALFTSACASIGCSDPPEEEESRAVQEMSVSFSRSLVTSTSILRFEIPNDPRFASRTASVKFEGRLLDGVAFEREYVALVQEDVSARTLFLEVDVTRGLWEDVGANPTEVFEGAVTIEVLDLLGPIARGVAEGVLLEFSSEIEPVVQKIESPLGIYPGQRLVIDGRGFLRPDEGTTYAIVERGTLEYGEDRPAQDVEGRRVAVLWDGARDRALLPAYPQIFGINPGNFSVSLRFENRLRDGGPVTPGSGGHTLAGEILEPTIESLTPLSASRSQVVQIKGQGFLPNSQENNFGMYLRYEGGLTPDADPDRTIDFRAQRAIERAPLRVLSGKLLEQDVWYSVDQETRTLTGLGALPGKFEGRVVPVLLYGAEQEIGKGLNISFRILPTRQIVYIRFLPSFTESLARFGLQNVSREVRAQVFTVLRRDYKGINIEFVDAPPENFADYMTLEIGGPDPTGQNLLGYDNSFNGVPKDTGNLFLRDYLGGYNRQSQDASFSPYGGVFIESFVVFSPTLSKNSPETTTIFDAIMAPVMPELGGAIVSGAEWPDGPRAERIQAAISLIGNLTGHTASHEIGHSLGLPYVEGEDPEDVLYHNEDEGKPYIMDSGISRPFEERAEIGGQGPSKFSPTNRRYLERILPIQ